MHHPRRYLNRRRPPSKSQPSATVKKFPAGAEAEDGVGAGADRLARYSIRSVVLMVAIGQYEDSYPYIPSIHVNDIILTSWSSIRAWDVRDETAVSHWGNSFLHCQINALFQVFICANTRRNRDRRLSRVQSAPWSCQSMA